MEENNLLSLTTDVVAAHVSNNNVGVGDLPRLIEQVHAALAGLGEQPAAEPEAKREPAVSIKASVKTDHLTCLVCGSKQKTLKRHLRKAHQMTPTEYREAFGLNWSEAVLADLEQQRVQLERERGLKEAEVERRRRG